MSLVYNEFEGSNKNGSDEELKMEKEKSEFNSKKKLTRRKTSSKEEEEKKDPIPNPKEKEKEKDLNEKYDTSMEGLEIPLLNNNINNGSLMLTELLDIENNNNKESLNNTNNNTNNRTLNITDNNNNNNNSSFLKKKLDNVNLPKSLKNDITSRIEKSHDEIHDDFKNDLLNISNKKSNITELIALNKSNNNIFLTGVDKISKENLKRLKSLKKEEQNIKKNIAKINMNTKIIEDGLSLKNNLVEENIRKSQLKNMNNLKENFVTKLIKINQKIEIILNEEKLNQKQKAKFDIDLKKGLEKHQKFCDQLELEKSGKLLNLLKERKEAERKAILKRKKEADEILEKSKKYLNEKFSKKVNDYRYYQLKEQFENNEKKLIDKINMDKKDPLVTKEELKD